MESITSCDRVLIPLMISRGKPQHRETFPRRTNAVQHRQADHAQRKEALVATRGASASANESPIRGEKTFSTELDNSTKICPLYPSFYVVANTSGHLVSNGRQIGG
jgi:hypothetical protein